MYFVNMDFAWFTQGEEEFNSNWWLDVQDNDAQWYIGTALINGNTSAVLGDSNASDRCLCSWRQKLL